jgi:hypothetical protein
MSLQNSPSLNRNPQFTCFKEELTEISFPIFRTAVTSSIFEDTIFSSEKNIINFQQEIEEKIIETNISKSQELTVLKKGRKHYPPTKSKTQNSDRKVQRKYSQDSYFKKIKRNFFKFLIRSVAKKHAIIKSDQREISDVSIQYCHQFLEISLKEFVDIFLDLKTADLKFIQSLKKEKVEDYFPQYLQSEHYNTMISQNLLKEGEAYTNELQKYSEGFVAYFKNTKPHNKKNELFL